MPLVTAEIDENDPVNMWTNKLAGKTIHDEPTNETAFCKKDLPEQHRVIGPNTRTTRDFRQDRLNFHTDDAGIVTHVTRG